MTPQPPNPNGRLLKVKAACLYLCVSPWTLRRLVQQGELPIVQYSDNGPWLLDVRDLDSWIERHKLNP
jgi:excisionase family DNA binding protein